MCHYRYVSMYIPTLRKPLLLGFKLWSFFPKGIEARAYVIFYFPFHLASDKAQDMS